MKPMYFGEDAIIKLPSGEEIIIFLSGHRSSRNEPIIGFKTPKGSTVIRRRVEKYLALFLQQLCIYQISCAGKNDELIVAARKAQAQRHYRKRYPDRGSIEVQIIEDSEAQPLASYPWYEQLKKQYVRYCRPPFFIGEHPQ